MLQKGSFALFKMEALRPSKLVQIAFVVTTFMAVSTVVADGASGNRSRLLETLATGILPSNNITETELLLASFKIDGLGQLLRRIFLKDDIRHVLPKPENVSQRCYDHVVDFADSLIGELVNATSKEYDTAEWAFRMMDAFGKPMSGIYRGTLQWVGNYDECLDVHAKIAAGTVLGSRPTARTSSSEFRAHYCRVQMLLPDLEDYAGIVEHLGFWKARKERPNLAHWGMCFPESCTENGVTTFLKTELEQLASVDVRNTICYERDLDFWSDAGAVFAACLLSLIAGIVVVCTILEYLVSAGCLHWHQGEEASSKEEPASKYYEMSPTTNGGDGNPDLHMKDNIETKVDNDLANGNASHNDDQESRSAAHESQQDKNSELKGIEGSSNTRFEPTAKQTEQRSGTGFKLLQAFSLRHNLSKLTSTSSTPNANMLGSIQGIRTISIAWIVLGHTHTIASTMDPRNFMTTQLTAIPELVSRFPFVITLAANLAVDTFFVMSGLLVMMLTLRELRKKRKQGAGFWIMFYVHRIWRLTPVYMMVLMAGTTLYDYLVEGPLKSEPYLLFEHCRSQWWTNLLYINNLLYPSHECMFWTWYLATDMQLFVISPIFIVLVHRKYRLGLVILVATVILGTAGTFVAALYNPGVIITITPTNPDYWENVYRVPWSRLAVFTVGMLAGVVLEDYKDKLSWSTMRTFLTWMVLTSIAVFVIGIPHDQLKDSSYYWSDAVQAVYESLSRLTWSLYVAWIIFACQTGLGGFVGRMLSWSGFQFFARLTYTVYLVHPLVITFFLYGGIQTFDLVEPVILHRFLGNLIISFFVAAVFTLMFESPTMALEKILLGRK